MSSADGHDGDSSVTVADPHQARFARWEHGSDFHLDPVLEPWNPVHPWGAGGLLTGSGRAALRLLLEQRTGSADWARLWIPSFFCQDVISAMHVPGLELRMYASRPDDAVWTIDVSTLEERDAILVVNFFGLQSRAPDYSGVPEGVEIVEDHTHDPWSRWAFNSDAHWCIASLRKTLPMSDGGIFWSPRELGTLEPPPLTVAHRRCSAEKLAGMALKGQYLAGGAVAKETYRRMLTVAKEDLAAGAPSAITPWSAERLATFPVERWRRVRRDNYRTFADVLGRVAGVRLLPADEDASPLAAVVVFDTPERRADVRAKLVAHSVYPAVLWPMDAPELAGVTAHDINLGRRILALHCDARYGPSDLERVGRLMTELSAEHDRRDGTT